MRLKCEYLRLGIVAILPALAGCGGFSASPSVSPASFFLPGLIKADPQMRPSDGTQPATQPVKQVAQAQ